MHAHAHDRRHVPTAGEAMPRKLITVRAEDDLDDAIGDLLRHRISGAPVVDDEAHVVGMLSEKDCICGLIDEFYESMPSPRVGETMSTELRCVTPDTDILSIAAIFLETRLRRLPVIDGGVIVGQISRRDVLAVLHRSIHHRDRPPAGQLYLSALGQRWPLRLAIGA